MLGDDQPQLDAAAVVGDVILGQARCPADPQRQVLNLLIERLPGNFLGHRHVGLDQQLLGRAALLAARAGGQRVGDLDRPRLES